jgi:AraC-like DNA-binding protein
MPFKRFIFSFFGHQINMPLVEDAGHIVTPTADKHPLTVHAGYELVFLKKGKFIYQLEGQPDIILRGGQLLLTKPNEVFSGKGGIFYPCNLFWLLFKPVTDSSIARTPFSVEEIQAVFDIFENVSQRVVRATPFLISLFKKYSDIMRICSETDPRPALHPDRPINCTPYQRALLRNLICAITLETAWCYESARMRPQSNCVQEACRFMEENYHEDINIADVVDHLNVSEAYLYKLFEAEMGQSPNNFLQTLRLEKASDLLLNSSFSITDIAFASGFSSSQYFTKAFKKYTGKTPSAFKKEAGQSLPDETQVKSFNHS